MAFCVIAPISPIAWQTTRRVRWRSLSLLAEGEDPESFFNGGYGPAPLTNIEREAIARPPDGHAILGRA